MVIGNIFQYLEGVCGLRREGYSGSGLRIRGGEGWI